MLWMVNKIRALQGYSPLKPDEGEMIAVTWLEALNKRRIPAEVYADLIDKAVDVRTAALTAGQRPPDYGVDLIIAMFNGYYTRERMIECEDCQGTGFMMVQKDQAGWPAATPCEHKNGSERFVVRKK